MSAGLKALRRIQIGIEGAGTPGTPVPATAKLIGTLKYDLDQKVYRPEDLETGRLSSFERSIPVGVMAKLPFESDANYEQLAYLFGMGIKGAVTPTGGSSLYTWGFTPNLAASAAVNTHTIEYGDDVGAFESAFCFAQGLELSGSLDDVVKVKANIVGQTVTSGITFTTGLLNPAVLDPVVVGIGKLYIDTTWAALGGALKAATLVDFNWKLTEGITPIKYLDGTLTFGDRAEKKRHIELDLTLAFNSNTTALWAAYIANPQTPVFVRLQFIGKATGAGYKTLTLDGCYTIDKLPPPFEERDGQNISKVKLISQYDPTSTKEWDVQLINGLSVMP